MNTGYALLHRATQALRQHADVTLVTPPTAACACCARPWQDVEDPGQAAEYKYGVNCAVEYVCTTCYTPRIGSEAMLGIERYSVGNRDNPVYAKLGMLPGSAGVITPSGALHLALPQALYDKFQSGLWAQRGQLHRLSGLGLLTHLLHQGELNQRAQGFVYVEQWGRKADALMQRFMASTSLQELWCNSESGATPLDLHAMLDTARRVIAMDLAHKADKPAFWRPITDAARGQRRDSAFESWLTQVPDPEALLTALPVNPHDRLRLTTMMRELIPLLQASRVDVPPVQGALL